MTGQEENAIEFAMFSLRSFGEVHDDTGVTAWLGDSFKLNHSEEDFQGMAYGLPYDSLEEVPMSAVLVTKGLDKLVYLGYNLKDAAVSFVKAAAI